MACPHTQQQTLIKASCPVMSPTGCTPEFCASGGMIRPLEPRVGENRSITVIKTEAEAFLREMSAEGQMTKQSFDQRLKLVLEEIDNGALETTVWEDGANENGELERVKVEGRSSRGWVQTREEIEWGIRVAWRNSRKCIMRAHYADLKLVDLRHVRTSRGMLDAIIENAPAAYNGGRILPNVLMFPPRRVNEMGPMFWSQQLLSFAGYEMPNGKTKGDPANVQLTKDIMALGWTPPEPKTRWDVLPVVAMAEGDEPRFAALPQELTKLVPIRHSKYQTIAELDLNWIRFPALSRLGFDIGGVQYTASPFIGFFMDAEIGVRNLADTFRYSVLPDVATAIGWSGGSLEDLPDHEKLVWLSRAQAELNYAVHSSFLQEGVTCTSTLAASQSWCAFDDQHLKEKGYRLNADPYWIAPPQGSIVPLWHRGFAPNYQPKPLIARHRFDPVKVWMRRKGTAREVASDSQKLQLGVKRRKIALDDETPKVHIFFCGTGGTALKLADRLLQFLKDKISSAVGEYGPLNSVRPEKIGINDTMLLLVATTGNGEVPSNGVGFAKNKSNASRIPRSVRYAVFGLGDSSYRDSFNGGSRVVECILRKNGLTPLLSEAVVESDVVAEDPPLSSFQDWCTRIHKVLNGESEVPKIAEGQTIGRKGYIQHYNMLKSFQEATVLFEQSKHKLGGMLKVSLEIPEPEFQDMGHIRLLPRNCPKMANKVMSLLGVEDESAVVCLSDSGGEASLQCKALKGRHCRPQTVSIKTFLLDFVDLYGPFLSMDWAQDFDEVENRSVIQVLEAIAPHQRKFTQPDSLKVVLFSMPTLQPRSYSVASSSLDATAAGPNKSMLDVLVHVTPGGRFSDQCLLDLGDSGKILYKPAANPACVPLLDPIGRPIIAAACGTGIAPVRSLLHRRLRFREGSETEVLPNEKIGLFLGFKTEELNNLIYDMVDKASKYDLLDLRHLVPSNKERRRVQDHFGDCQDILTRKLIDEGGYLYLCGNEIMVRESREKLQGILGIEAWQEIQERVIEETF